MAEQAQVKPKSEERPQVRYVELSEVVYLPDAPRLAQDQQRARVDCESKAGREHSASLQVCDLGVLVRYAGYVAGKTVPRQHLIPWNNIKNVDLSPDWRP